MNETVPAPVNPVHTKKRDWHVFGFVVAGILLCTLAALLAFPQLTKMPRIAYSAHVVSQVLPGALYVSDGTDVSYLRTATPDGYTPVPFGGLLISAVQSKLGVVSVVRDAQGVFNVRLGDRTLVQSTFAISSADVSPDGVYVVYTVQTKATEPLAISSRVLPFLTLTTSDWTVVAQDIKTGKNIYLGEGVQPFFKDATHVVKIAPAGISMVEVSSGTAVMLSATPVQAVYMAPLVSPDRTYVGIAQADTRAVTIYKVDESQAVLVGTTPLLENVSSYALGASGLYALQSMALGMDVLLLPYEQTNAWLTVVRIPVEMAITRIIP